MAGDESVRLSVLEHCRGGFTPITPLIDQAAPKTTLYRCKDDLIQDGLLETDGKDRYMTSAKGMLEITSLKGENPKGLTALYSPLALVPTPQHKAVIELAFAAVNARKFNVREDRHPTIIIMGPTLTWKTSTGIFLCHMIGLDASTQIVNLAAESGRSLWLRKTSTGKIVYKRELLDTPLVVFDEYQSADPESKRLLRIWMDGRKNVAIDNEKLTIQAVPLLTLNPTKAESLEDRLGVRSPQIRRSITCDLTGITLPNLAMNGEDIIAAARNQQPLALKPPQHDLKKYKPQLYDLFTATLNSVGQELADIETLIMLSTAMTAYFDAVEAIRLVFFDALVIFETLGWINPGWAVHVKNFPTRTNLTTGQDSRSIPEETWVEAFKFLNEGGAATELVGRFHLHPDSALLITKKHNELKASTNDKRSTQEIAPTEDSETLKLQKDLKLAQLRRQKTEQEQPFEIDKKMTDLQDKIIDIQAAINDQGSWKKEHCSHFQDNYCRYWSSTTRPSKPFQISEPLQKDDKWYINPNLIRCATCSSYLERGVTSTHDVYQLALRTESRVSAVEHRLSENPADSLRESECLNCKAKGSVAVKMQCIRCNVEIWRGWRPQQN